MLTGTAYGSTHHNSAVRSWGAGVVKSLKSTSRRLDRRGSGSNNASSRSGSENDES